MEQILLLEDDPALGEGIRMALQLPEVTIRLCGSLAQARRLLGAERFALLILDVNLPDGSGLSLLSRAAARTGAADAAPAGRDAAADHGGALYGRTL